MLDIKVLPPTKTDTLYEFRCRIRSSRTRLDRLVDRVSRSDEEEATRLRFGYRALDFTIRHHEIWDGFYPLFFLTRKGGPLFETGEDEARIRFTYPIPRPVRDFFVRRAADLGSRIEVEAELTEARFERPGEGHVLSFGGGKDSRLILGVLRETGVEPTLYTTRGPDTADVPAALRVKPLHPVLTDRIMASFMHLGRHLYYGGGFGETHLRTPWHEYYDMASARGRGEMSALFDELGAGTRLHGPVVVLPYNQTQRILSLRYPDLYAGQTSTRIGAANEKSLHVALLRLYHGLPHTDRIEEPVFAGLLSDFVTAQLERPADFGPRDLRETINREMRSIIWRRRDHPSMAPARDRIPADWDGAWIDYIHTYADPDIDPAWLAIYREYAPTVDEADPSEVVDRVEV